MGSVELDKVKAKFCWKMLDTKVMISISRNRISVNRCIEFCAVCNYEL